MNNIPTPEEILEQLKNIDKDFVDVNIVVFYKKDWCVKNEYDYAKHIDRDENFEFSPVVRKNDNKYEFIIFLDSKPEYIMEYLIDMITYINQIKIKYPNFHLLKKNYLNFKQNEERLIKIIKAMMD